MLKKLLIGLLLVIFISGGIGGYLLYTTVYKPNVSLGKHDTAHFYVHTGWDVVDVLGSLYDQNYITNHQTFEWVVEQKNYANLIKPGRYLLKSGMNNNELVNLLRSGQHEPIQVIFNNIRLKEELAGKIATQIEADSSSLLQLLNDEQFAKTYGFSGESFMSMIIPNTYEFYWNTSAEQFFKRMAKEYKAFWTPNRKNKAKSIGLSQSEVAALAAIVQKETKMADEKPRVAGVYINRLKKDMLLQADPTLIFAAKDFTIKRVLNIHKRIDSPYNTYMYKGLPPGPITLPEISSIDAVLNYEKHNYLFFCAKDDFSGYHNFAKNFAQHKLNARKYQRALNKKKVYR